MMTRKTIRRMIDARSEREEREEIRGAGVPIGHSFYAQSDPVFGVFRVQTRS
jgi:hypothetical protein